MRGRSALVLATALVAALACSSVAAVATTVKGVSFPDAVAIGGKECRLNGVGVRTKFLVSVYLGSLYLATPSGDAAAIVAADEPKRTVMHFLHSKVGSGKIREAWQEGFENNAGEAFSRLGERLERFRGFSTGTSLREGRSC